LQISFLIFKLHNTFLNAKSLWMTPFSSRYAIPKAPLRKQAIQVNVIL